MAIQNLYGMGVKVADVPPVGTVYQDDYSLSNVDNDRLVLRTADNNGTNDGWTYTGALTGGTGELFLNGLASVKRAGGGFLEMVGVTVTGPDCQTGGVASSNNWRNNLFAGIGELGDLVPLGETFIGVRNFSGLQLYRYYEGTRVDITSGEEGLAAGEEFRVERIGNVYTVYRGPGASAAGGTVAYTVDVTAELGTYPKWGTMTTCGLLDLGTNGHSSTLSSLRIEDLG